ncbi:MAG: ATP-binding protein [Gelidibacter sp.]|nr:ATP-binding protein [Gelidibacter sp.]
MANNNQDSLFKAFGLFIEAFRPYIVSLLMEQEGDKWPARFVEVLSFEQKEKWNMGLRNGSTAETLIDFHHLKSFAIREKDLLKKDFGRSLNSLPNWLSEIAQLRHEVAHFSTEINEDEATKVWIHMKMIAKIIGMPELEEELKKTENFYQTKSVEKVEVISEHTIYSGALKPWFQIAQPHFDIKQGRLDESVFAANLAEVALGNGREIYKDPNTFFSKTYFTAGLKSVAKTVIKGLNGKEDAENRVISLQTGFGGGKTHTLISIYHLCNWGKSAVNSPFTNELLAYTGNPEFEKANIAVFTNTTNDPTQGRKVEGITIRTIWGEIAYQLGGIAAYNLIKDNDEKLSAPKGLFKKVLEQCKPALILIDELADYCVSASAITVGKSSLADQTISFMQELTEAVAGTEKCVAIITLPASVQEVANSPEAASILNSLQSRVSRVGADTQPVAEDEIYEVIRRRLFEDIGDKAYIEKVANEYIALYEQHWTELPSNAAKSEYKKKIIQSYPFHPELVDIFKIKWASNNNFQRTRGVLRLLAAIVSDLWKRQQSLPGANILIHSGNVYLPNLDTITSQLKKLYGNGYESVISADIAGSSSNAFKIDSNKTEYGQFYLTQSIATVILMNSFGSEGTNKGLSVPELKLHLLAPNSFNHNSINGALSDLENAAYYLYSAQTGNAGKRYWFHVKPNISMLINQGKQDVKQEDIYAEVLKRLKEKTNNRIQLFNVLVDPSEDIPEQVKPTLIILHPKNTATNEGPSSRSKDLIEKIATKKGNSERIYRNTILFLIASDGASGKLYSNIRDYLACQKIASDYSSTLERDQKEDLKKKTDDASRSTDSALVTTYATISKFSVKNGCQNIQLKQFKDSFENQINTNIIDILKEEEWLLEMVGLNLLKNNNLLPTIDTPIKARDVYETFLRFDDKPMITGTDAVSKSLLRYCINNEFCIAYGDGKVFTKYYLGETVPFFDVNDILYWLVDKSQKPAAAPSTVPETQNQNPFEPSTTQIEKVEETEQGNNSTRTFKSITISGKVPLEQYTQLFNSFVMPLAQNNIEIEIRIKGKSTNAKPITENSQEYKIVKESAKQLGLFFEED